MLSFLYKEINLSIFNYSSNLINYEIMMKKVLVLLTTLLVLCSCGTTKLTQKQITQSAWISASPSEVNGIEGTVMMTLLFSSETDVIVMVSVQSEDNLIVKPFEYARGTYAIDETNKNGNGLILNLKDIQGNPYFMKGTCEKGQALVLISNDNVTRLFGRIKDFKFE